MARSERRQYWTNTQILKHDADYNIVVGGRNLGKSYATKKFALENAWKTKQVTFVLIRRFDLECKPSHIENYFADCPVLDITHNQFNCVTAKAGTIYFSTYDVETGKVKHGVPCGKYIALSGAQHVKSESFPFITDVIFEEFCATEYLNENEPDTLQHLISTIARSNRVRVWLIGNTVNRANPYIKKWDLHNVSKQEIGTIEDYTFHTTDGEVVKIAVEYARSDGASNGMFFGHIAKSINGGAWECNEHPRLALPLSEYTEIYKVLLKYIDFRFILLLLSNDETGKLCLYAYPYTNNGKPCDRILSLDYSENMLESVWFFKDSEIESKILELLDRQQIAFSDNLTGDEVIQTLKALKTSTL